MRTAIIAAALLAAAPAFAQQPGVAVPGAGPVAPAARAGPPAPPATDNVRVNQLIVYGDDPCPRSTDPDVITVCAHLPENDRYRVPPNLRNNPNDPASQSWANRATELSYVGRTGTDSCSTVGGGGFTGCFNQIVNQAQAERHGVDQVTWARMIEAARQERLSHIDEQARQAEAAAQAEEQAHPPQN